MPDRVVLTWSGDPATTQSVTWRTDTSVLRGVAEVALAVDHGKALRAVKAQASTVDLKSDLNEAHYHTVTFLGLEPDTLYAYRVGDGVNWSEFFHFRTASREAKPFTFVYFGDAQNDIKTHWSRVFREAFRDAPRAAFTLHAGDLIDEDAWDAEWGEWHRSPAWVNATVPVVATPGNHEYYRHGEGPEGERFWTGKDGVAVSIDVVAEEFQGTEGRQPSTRLVIERPDLGRVVVVHDDDEIIRSVEGPIAGLVGFSAGELMGTNIEKSPLFDRIRVEGEPRVSRHWRPQFAFPVVESLPEALHETVYHFDYQGVRFISLDSNRDRDVQVPWLRSVLASNPHRWVVITFHHPVFSPARDRDNRSLRELWKPIFDEFKVDLILCGHDHTYARTGDVGARPTGENVPDGYQMAYDPQIGTVHVVSVSGPKMYPITKGDYAVRTAEDTQLYQIITVDGDELRYEARTATGRLYDTFRLRKRPGKTNELIEALPPENRRR